MTNKIVIIGAPRSGTNMLRDLLVKHDDFGTWPCDEINYIWRYRNKSHPSDEFTPEMADTKTAKFINEKFDAISRSTGMSNIVEKTCANSLRVGFVNRVLPGAKYVFIVRDGRDAVASALKRWKADLDIPYLLKKARYVPPTDLPYYGLKYVYSRVHKVFSKESRLSIWGPRLDDLDHLLKTHSLEQVCGLQWQRCVENAERDFSSIDNANIYRLRYEDFVADPADKFYDLAQFLAAPITREQAQEHTSFVKRTSVGRGSKELDEKVSADVSELISETLTRYGYQV